MLKVSEAVQYGLIAVGAFILTCVTAFFIKAAFCKSVSTTVKQSISFINSGEGGWVPQWYTGREGGCPSGILAALWVPQWYTGSIVTVLVWE